MGGGRTNRDYEMMDVNSVMLSGRLYAVGLHPMKTQPGFNVAEGRLSVSKPDKDDTVVREEFCIRAYGKKSDFIGNLPEGTHVIIQGRLTEDIRINSSEYPVTTRSKTYVDVDKIRVMGGAE